MDTRSISELPLFASNGDARANRSLAEELSISDQPLLTTLRDMARTHAWRLLVLFGSAARGERARDLDLAALPSTTPNILEQGAWLAELETLLAPWPVDLVVLSTATSPVTRFEVFRDGRCLWEAEPGLFGREQDRAFFLHADSAPIRRQMHEVLHGRAKP